MSLLTVVLLTHNRPLAALSALESILAQTEADFHVLVSDNSTNREFGETMKARYPEIEYRSWFPGVPAFVHFKHVISLIDTRYFVMFHDDDLMEPQYVRKILDEFAKNRSIAAIGTNAWLIGRTGAQLTDRQSFRNSEPRITLIEERSLLRHYLVGDLGGIAPWCSYMYNTERIRGLYPDFSRGRNFCDTVFLLDVIRRGPIVWINEPLIRVRVHEGNLSDSSGVRDYKAFLKIVQARFGPAIPQRELDEYRFMRLAFALRRRRQFPPAALIYLVSRLPVLAYSSRSFRARLMRKIFS